MFSQPVRSVAPAALARVQHDKPAMRRMFLSTTSLLAAVTLPVCVLLAVVADPLIRFVYGDIWQPAAAVLPWLALLGALRIMFELCYDYFVVLANTRVVFSVQVVWLVALLPALWIGAHQWGVGGAGAAQLAVGLVIVLPIYLYELRRVGISPGAFLSRLGLPILGAVVVTGVAAVINGLTSIDLLILTVTGIAGAAVIAFLVYNLRATVRSLRAT
jgi:PST family polysaccharide transporter